MSGLQPVLAVHPHGCGEHEESEKQNRVEFGSSPRVWGTSAAATTGAGSVRFIPTGVGNMLSHKHRLALWPVHPHGCGEHMTFKEWMKKEGGSSPRVWGTFNLHPVCRYLRRFIPTGVGNISKCSIIEKAISVHPHGCGEHSKAILPLYLCLGSSPRVWGTSNSEYHEQLPNRFIPTGVGNIASAYGARHGKSVHPHGCGEHSDVQIRKGYTSVHPHGCGEHLYCSTQRGKQNGSSPRVWGT